MVTRSRTGVAGIHALAGIFVLVGCGQKPPRRPETGDVIRLEIKDRTLRVEVSNDDMSRAVGLMERKSLAEDAGMLFVYDAPDRLAFWMRNTYIPLSIAFLDDSGKILQIEDMRPKAESRTASKNDVRYALEVNQGWFERNGIGVGDAFSGFEETVRPYHGS